MMCQNDIAEGGKAFPDWNNSAGRGGGAYVNSSSATLNGEQILSNSANIGGGVFLGPHAHATSDNSAIADNQAGLAGSGVHL
jgi:hypothetical protein